MTPRLPVISGRSLLKALGRVGWEYDHHEGSHMILRWPQPPHRRLSIPDHREFKKGTLRHILQAAGLTPEELNNLL